MAYRKIGKELKARDSRGLLEPLDQTLPGRQEASVCQNDDESADGVITLGAKKHAFGGEIDDHSVLGA
jgi:hypothetical protein